MRNVKVSALQFSCSKDVNENISTAERLIREAALKGAQIILLPELFERQYFCQERRYEYYGFATPVPENPAVKKLSPLAKE
ncbi:MAG: N-carbamoylputrescine amidase, partial [Lachnospiraceae bacterium]|nr:N-carbamoylputrescine amidase [Lachnospiraceae bacterium]